MSGNKVISIKAQKAKVKRVMEPVSQGPKIVTLDYPLDINSRQIIPAKKGMTFAQAARLARVEKALDGCEAVISINGNIVPAGQWPYRVLRDDDWLLIVPKAGDDEVLRVVAIVAIGVIAPHIAGATLGVPADVAMASWAGITIAGAVIVGGGILINNLLPPPSPKSAEYAYAEELSASKGWNPATVQQQGIPVQRVYGRVKSYGNVVQAYRRVTGASTNEQDLYVMICLGDNPMREPVIEGTMKLIDQPIDNLSGIYYQVRRGEIDQKYMSYFPDCKSEITVNRLVTNTDGAEVYETVNKDFDNLIIVLSFPFGLYDNSAGSIANWTVNVTVEVKKTTASAWQAVWTGDITDGTLDKVIREVETDGTVFIERGYKYSTRVTKNTSDKDPTKYGDKLYIESVIEITDEPFTYPKRNLVGIKALETDNLSGTIRFSCHSMGNYVRTYDGSWAIEYTNNNAWVGYDILTQPVLTGSRSPWLDLKLMLNFEGSDGATATVDDSPNGHSITFAGDAQLDTAADKFGSSSLLLDGTGDYISAANDDDSFDMFDNLVDDWTADFFAALDVHSGVECFCGQYVDADNYWYFRHNHGSGLDFRLYVAGAPVVDLTAIGGEITDTSWHHLSICKVGDELGFYKDGTQLEYHQLASGELATFDADFVIGSINSTHYVDGHIDHFRIVQNNIFSAAPASDDSDTITVPIAAWADPGNSFAVSRYDCYDPLQMDTDAWEDLADWCATAQVNDTNYGINNITQANKAIVTTTSKHERIFGDIVLFRNVQSISGMEITDGTQANVLSVIDDNTFMIDIDTSGYNVFVVNLRLHMQFEGEDGDTSFIDSAQGHVFSINNSDPEIDTSQYKFGSSSMYCNNNDVIETPDSDDWDIFGSNSDDWTIDFFLRRKYTGAVRVIMSQYQDANNNWHISIVGSPDEKIRFYIASGGFVRIDAIASTNLVADQWYHVAVCKVANEYGVYIDGTQEAYDSDSNTGTMAAGLCIGGFSGGSNGMGSWIDELRINHGNIFNAAPNSTPDDTITVPTSSYTPPTVEEYAPRFAFNGIYDTAGDPWKAALQVLEQCRAVPYWKGSKISVAIDKAASPVYMFGPGNCIEGSLRHKYLKMRERAQEIEAHFKDRAYDYERRPISDINASIGNPANKIRMDYFGVTDERIVRSLIENRLLKNLYEKRTIAKRVDVDAIGVTIGDVVWHQDNLSNWGKIGSLSQDYTGGGRIRQATNGPNAEVTINGNIVFLNADFEGGSITYELQVKLSDDTVETKTITGHDGSVFNLHKITVSGSFTICPKAGDIWAAGRQNLVSKKFRVIDVQLNSLMQADIILSQYADEVYAGD